MSAPLDWQLEARRILRAQLARKDVSYKALARALESVGIVETPKALGNRINRGTFSFSFFLQCLYVLGDDVVRLWDRALPMTPRTGNPRPKG